MDYPAGALVRIHPVSDLQDTKLKQSQIDYVAFNASDLNSVPDVKGLSDVNECPSRDIHKQVFQCDGYTCGKQSQKSDDRLEIADPEISDYQSAYRKQQVFDGFSPVILLSDLFRVSLGD